MFTRLLSAVICCILCGFNIALFSNFGSGKGAIAKLKAELLQECRRVNRGLTETSEDRNKILTLIENLERKNTVKDPIKSNFLSGNWILEYTTSDTILGRKGPKKVGSIFQSIDIPNLKAENAETVEYLGFFRISRKVKADLNPMSKSKVEVLFRRFFVGPFSFQLPKSPRGELEFTYLDENLRISRGDKKNVFVLTK